MGKEKESTTKGDVIQKACPESYEAILDAKGSAKYRFPDKNNRKGCGVFLPAQTKTCPFCGFFFERIGDEADLSNLEIELTEIDILNASPFRYVDLFASTRIMMASGFEAWAGIFSPNGEDWHAIGKVKNQKPTCVLIGEKLMAMAAADDFLRIHETDSGAKKTKRWLDDQASEKQIEMLNTFGYGLAPDLLGNCGMNKYESACHMNFQFARRDIENLLGV